MEEMRLPGWEAWVISVQLGPMPDGTIAPIGLHIDPREDYDGSLRDQRITLERLRRFPIGAATTIAKAVGYDGTTREGVGLLGDALAARADLAISGHEQRMIEYRRKAKAMAADLYRAAGWTDRQIRIQEAADYYREAQRDPDVASPRQFVADHLDVSPRTVDEYLAEARKTGYLEPYDGQQGKHGKPKARKRK